MNDIPFPEMLLRAALAHHRDGHLPEAEALYRRALDIDPRQPLALRMLGTILMERPGDTEAEPLFRRHLAMEPDNHLTLYCLGRLQQGKGQDKEAAALFRRAAVGLPDLASILNDLGVSLHRLGRRDEALVALDQAVTIAPFWGQAHDNRGLVLYDCRRFKEAAEAHRVALSHTPLEAEAQRIAILLHFARAADEDDALEAAEQACRAVLEIAPDNAAAIERLAGILERWHRNDEAISLCNRLARFQGLTRTEATQRHDATVLLLGSVGASHVPTRYLFDPAWFATETLILMSPDQPDAPLGSVAFDDLTGADLIFNMLGEVERTDGQGEAVKTLAARLGKPLLNPPDRIARTGRDQAPRLLGDIPGLVVPAVRRMPRHEPVDPAHVLGPQLIRPCGAHGGQDLALIKTPSDLTDYLAAAPHDRFLLTAFHDFKGEGGCYRKYRFIFVDRQPFPYHLAIAETWLVHYWRAEMGCSPWKKREEEAFLTDWRQVFGPRAAAAVDQVAQRLDLDYGGLDCSLLPDGEVLFFEANACMLVHLDEAEAEFPYKHRAVPRIRDAITHMVRARIDGAHSWHSDLGQT